MIISYTITKSLKVLPSWVHGVLYKDEKIVCLYLNEDDKEAACT